MTGKLRANIEEIPYLSGRPRYTDDPIMVLEPSRGGTCFKCPEAATYTLIERDYRGRSTVSSGSYCANHMKDAFWEKFTA